MKKKLFSLFAVLALCVCLAANAFAADLPLLVDSAGLLSDSQAQALEQKLNEISRRQQVDVVVLTIDSIGSMDAEEAAIYLYEKYHYGQGAGADGMVLLISLEYRDWALDSVGYGGVALNDDAHGYVSDTVVPYLSDGDYYTAFCTYADLCDQLVTMAREGHPYRTPFAVLPSLLISFGISLVVGLIVTGSMKSKLNSVRAKDTAFDYVEDGSFQLNLERDRYLYSTVSRTEKPRDNGSGTHHSSSGGHSHTSSSGKF